MVRQNREDTTTCKPNLSNKLLSWLLALTVSTITTWQVYHAQFSSRFDLFPGPRGDTRLIAYLVEHWYQALSGHADLLSPAMFYPVKGTLGYSDVVIAYVLPYSALRSAGFDIFTALAIAVVILNYLNFILCFVLLSKVLKFGSLPACAGSLFFAFNNPRLAQGDHLQLEPLLFLLLCVISLMFFVRRTEDLSQKRAFGLLAMAAIFLNLQLLTSFYIGWFFIFWSVLFLALSCCIPRSRLFLLGNIKKYSAALVGAGLVFCIGFALFLRIYIPSIASTGWFGLSSDYIPELGSYLLMADGNYVWGSLTALLLQGSGTPDWGRRVGIGLVPSLTWMGLSIFALWIIRNYSKTPTRSHGAHDWTHIGYLFFAVMVLASNFLIMLGLQYQGHSLWKFVYWSFPGARSIRAVARYILLLALPIAIALTFAVDYAMTKIATQSNGLKRKSLTVSLLMVIAFGLLEQLNSGQGEFSIALESARLEKLTAELPADCSFFYVAPGPASIQNSGSFQNQNYMHDAMLVSILTGVPTVNGRSGKNPPGWSLREVRAANYEENVRRWIQQHDLGGHVCRLVIND